MSKQNQPPPITELKPVSLVILEADDSGFYSWLSRKAESLATGYPTKSSALSISWFVIVNHDDPKVQRGECNSSISAAERLARRLSDGLENDEVCKDLASYSAFRLESLPQGVTWAQITDTITSKVVEYRSWPCGFDVFVLDEGVRPLTSALREIVSYSQLDPGYNTGKRLKSSSFHILTETAVQEYLTWQAYTKTPSLPTEKGMQE